MARTRSARIGNSIRLEALEVRDLPSFLPTMSYSVGNGPMDIVVADVNGDNYRDVALTLWYEGQLQVLFGDGTGKLAGFTKFPTGGKPHGVGVSDFNRDGNADLVNSNDGANTISLLAGNGNGTFQDAQFFPSPNEGDLVVADFHGDGQPDVAAVYCCNSTTVSVLRGHPDGTFGPATAYDAGNQGIFIETADLNRDGLNDLTVSNWNYNTVSVLLNQGQGVFAPRVPYATGEDPLGQALGDINRDGRLDMVASHYSDTFLSVFLGNGDGTFQQQIKVASGVADSAPALADFNRDRKLDVVWAGCAGPDPTECEENAVYVQLGNGNGTFQPKLSFLATRASNSVSVADLNNDRWPDVVVGDFVFDDVGVLLNDKTWAPPIPPAGPDAGPSKVELPADERALRRVELWRQHDGEVSSSPVREHAAMVTAKPRLAVIAFVERRTLFEVFDETL